MHILSAQNNLQFVKSLASAESLVGNNGITVKDIIVDLQGNSYVLGHYIGTVDFDPSTNTIERTAILTDGFVVKFDAGGNLIWLNTEAVAADQEACAGVINSGSIFSKKLTVVYKNSLNSFSLKQLNLSTGVTTFTSVNYATNSGSNVVNINNIAVNDTATATTYLLGGSFAGNLTLGNSTVTSSGGLDAFTASFSTASETNPFAFQWVNRYGGTGADEINDLRISTTSSFTVVGYFSQTADFDGNASTNTISRASSGLKDAFYMIANTSNGQPLGAYSVITFGGSGNDAANSISGEVLNCLVGGYFSGTVDFDPNNGVVNKTSNGGTDAFVLRLDSVTPDLAWVNTFGGSTNDESVDIVTNTGLTRIYYAYHLGNSTNGKTIGLGSYYSDGTTNTNFGGLLTATSNTSENYPVAIAYNDLNGVYLTGIYNDEVDFNSGSGVSSLVQSNSGNDAFLLKMTSCGFPAITPEIQVSGNFCSGQPLTFSIANANLRNNSQWYWYSESCGGTLVGTGQTLTIIPTSNATYFVRGEGGCAGVSQCDSYDFSFNPSPSGMVSLNQTTLQAVEPNATYQWINCSTGSNIPGANQQSFSPTSAGNYAVLVINAQGCQTQSDCINFGCISATKPILTGDRYICNALYTSVPVSINSGDLNNNNSWAWYSGSCGGTFLGSGLTRDLPIGTYYVKAVGGCAADGPCSDPFTVSFYSPEFIITQVGNTLQVVDIPGAIYAWTACNDNSVTLSNQPTFTPTTNGSYKVYVGWSLTAHCASGAGCFDYNGPLGNADFADQDVFMIAPNPIINDFEIKATAPIVEVILYNLLGSKVATFNHQLRYTIDGLPSGMYLIQIRSTSHTVVKKIFKE